MFCFSNETPQLYTVLPEKRADRMGQAMMGSAHVYDIGATTTTQKSKFLFPISCPTCIALIVIVITGSGGVELSLDPSELERLDSDSMAARYGHCENNKAIWLRKISVIWLPNTQLNKRYLLILINYLSHNSYYTLFNFHRARGSDSNNRQTANKQRSTRNSNFKKHEKFRFVRINNCFESLAEGR